MTAKKAIHPENSDTDEVTTLSKTIFDLEPQTAAWQKSYITPWNLNIPDHVHALIT